MATARENLSRIYQSFHGLRPTKMIKVRLPYREIPEDMVLIGQLVALEYQVVGTSERKGTLYRHEFGDTGGKKRVKAPVLLATDKSRRMFYILPTSSRHPFFSGRGIVG